MSMDVNGVGGGNWSAQSVSSASGNWRAPPQQKMADHFSNIDTANTGSISKDQFSSAFQNMKPPAAFQAAGVNSVWNALDPNNTGQVSKNDFISTMKNLMVSLRNHDADQNQTATTSTQDLNSFYV